MTESELYGCVESAADVATAGVGDALYADEAQLPVDGQLWSYHNTGRINGVPVVADDRGLKVDDERMLGVAFYLRRTLRSMLLYLSPDDQGAQEAYDRLLEKVNDNSVEIVDEIRQWDPEHSRFVLWVRYNELEYALNPRFAYLREE